MTDSTTPLRPIDAAIRKAAILVTSLPLDEATHLTQSLDAEQLERLADAIAQLEQVANKEQRMVAAELTTTPASLAQSPQAALELNEYRRRLEEAEPAVVCAVLRQELPQTIALILSEMNAAAAANVLTLLPTDRQIAVAKRMARIRPNHHSIVTTLLHFVSESVLARSQPLRQSAGGESFLAHVINCTDRATERALLENLAQENRALVDRLLQRMYLLKDSRRPQLADADGDATSATRRAG